MSFSFDVLNSSESETMSLGKLDEMIDVCQSALDEIWRLPHHYPQNRMCSIFDMICRFAFFGGLGKSFQRLCFIFSAVRVVTSCTEHLTELDMWDIGTVSLDDAIGHVKETLESWIQTFDSLTRLFWPNYEPHPWLGEPYRSKLLTKFQTRYKEVRTVRSVLRLLQ